MPDTGIEVLAGDGDAVVVEATGRRTVIPREWHAALLDALLEAEGWKRDDGIRSLHISYVKDAHVEGKGFSVYMPIR